MRCGPRSGVQAPAVALYLMASLCVELRRCCMRGRETASGRMEKSAVLAPVPKQKVSIVERRSWLDRLVGQPRRRGLSNLWYGAQFPARLICPAASGLAGARDVGLDPGHAKGRRLAPGATLHMSQNGMWAIGMPRRASARAPHRVKQSRVKRSVTVAIAAAPIQPII
jgi:hypothetical protein